MKVLEQVAQTVVEQTSALLGVSMSITNAEGLIIGCHRKNVSASSIECPSR